ncbi:hypothetical protein GCM10011309_23720 [Litorimonas cladophorae]|uniref:DUF805 domain-containing protein n=1 Tax=Litorimonas cladophorae TaxID=1220491 RepID=A0A918KQQ9_9PROT|nr:DUF805 domain-containing protein [Litorimonas cladophorae]GGX72608.1 hypothetical protein GCM10011309_23720 [Litorimonas cladophorae]
MGFQDAVKSFFSRWSDFKTRSSRSEYWWSYLGIILIALVVGFVIGLLSAVLGETIGSILMGVFYLIIIVPSIAIGVRRLHDHDKSGWWYLLALVPLANFYILYLFVTKGTDGPNRFGADPLGSDAAVFN